jgi:hypothetical protein
LIAVESFSPQGHNLQVPNKRYQNKALGIQINHLDSSPNASFASSNRSSACGDMGEHYSMKSKNYEISGEKMAEENTLH